MWVTGSKIRCFWSYSWKLFFLLKIIGYFISPFFLNQVLQSSLKMITDKIKTVLKKTQTCCWDFFLLLSHSCLFALSMIFGAAHKKVILNQSFHPLSFQAFAESNLFSKLNKKWIKKLPYLWTWWGNWKIRWSVSWGSSFLLPVRCFEDAVFWCTTVVQRLCDKMGYL